MPRYFFNLREGNKTLIDEHGEVLPDDEAAKRRAVESVGEILRDYPPQHPDQDVAVDVIKGERPVWRILAQVHIQNLR
jgi:hypothetical protein